MASSTTRCCHAGRDDLARLRVHAPPLDLSSTYPLHDLEAAESAFDAFERGEVREHMPIYARLHNPTVGRFERALAELEGTEAAVGVRLRDGGGHRLPARRARSRWSRGRGAARVRRHRRLALLGLDVAWARADEVGRAMRLSTALVLVESPQNPTLGLVDIGAIVEAAAGVPVLVDNTFATPVLQNPARHGASLVLHSATKYLGGHGDVVGGVVASSEAVARRLRRIRVLTGGVMHPLAAYLLHRGLPTLPLRVRRAQEQASVLASGPTSSAHSTRHTHRGRRPGTAAAWTSGGAPAHTAAGAARRVAARRFRRSGQP
jgi:methionine-gamma-lyase